MADKKPPKNVHKLISDKTKKPKEMPTVAGRLRRRGVQRKLPPHHVWAMIEDALENIRRRRS